MNSGTGIELLLVSLKESLISSSCWVDTSENLVQNLTAHITELHCKLNTKPSHVL